MAKRSAERPEPIRLTGDLAGPGRIEVASASRPDRGYVLTFDGTDAMPCTCEGYTYGGRCWHQAAVGLRLRAERQQRAAVVARAAARLEQIALEFGCDERPAPAPARPRLLP